MCASQAVLAPLHACEPVHLVAGRADVEARMAAFKVRTLLPHSHCYLRRHVRRYARAKPWYADSAWSMREVCMEYVERMLSGNICSRDGFPPSQPDTPQPSNGSNGLLSKLAIQAQCELA